MTRPHKIKKDPYHYLSSPIMPNTFSVYATRIPRKRKQQKYELYYTCLIY